MAEFAGLFARVYAEKRALGYPLARRMIELCKNAALVEIDSYKDIFYRRNQVFAVQRRSRALILAVNSDGFVFKGSRNCDNFGYANFYCHTSVINCVYDCEYCYLAAKYPCAHIVMFVNYEDSFDEVSAALAKTAPAYFCVSYDTDLLALESRAGILGSWLRFAAGKSGLLLEIRTKSANFKAIEHITPLPNVILAWTLSPESVAERFERGAPPLSARIQNMRAAAAKGWNVRVCFDPVLYFDGWREQYAACVERTFAAFAPENVHSVSAGVFRAPPGGIDKMDAISHVCAASGTYGEDVADEIKRFIKDLLREYVPEDNIRVF
jgi:spore photoproduct lyase